MADIGNQGLFRFIGQWGAAYDPSNPAEPLSDAVEVSGAVEIGRVDMPLVGRTSTGYKPGRETREGTIRIQKIDTKWEMKVFNFLSQSIAERRRARDNGLSSLPTFNIQFEYDDPNALGIEKWQLNSCMIWRLPLGFSITDDVVEREYPLTWESEVPIYAYEASKATTPQGTMLRPKWFTGHGPPVGVG